MVGAEVARFGCVMRIDWVTLVAAERHGEVVVVVDRRLVGLGLCDRCCCWMEAVVRRAPLSVDVS